MNTPTELVRSVTAALEIDPRVNRHRLPLHVGAGDGALLIEGEVDDIVAKRVALRIARDLAGRDGVVDRLHLRPADPRPDGDMLDALTRSLLAAVDLRNCTLRRRHRGTLETLREAPGDASSGELSFAVVDGVVELDGRVLSLSHRRIVEALAWWVPGCRDVVDRLHVEPPEQDGDTELADAVRLVLEMDPSLAEADQVGINVRLGVVSLHGVLREPAQKRRAEQDAWAVDGVNEVLNAIELAP